MDELFAARRKRGIWSLRRRGACITADISESPSSDGGCILSDILMDDVPEKYFLSEAAMRRICGS